MKFPTVAICAAAIFVAAYPFVQPRLAAQGQAASRAQSQGPPDRVVEGTLEVVYEDAPDAPRLKHFLNTGAERVELQFSGPPPNLQTGTRIRAHGRLRNHQGVSLSAQDDVDNNVLALGTWGGGTNVVALASSSTFGPQSTIVILINFSDHSSPTPTVSQAQTVTFTDVNNFDLENSFNQTSLTGVVAGRFNIASTSTSCLPADYNSWATLADQAATTAGYNLSLYPRRVYSFPQTNACAWWGLGTVGGGTPANPSHAWINGTFSLHVVAHEMGHNFGLYHSRSNTCDSTGCVVDEYGDDHDVMGGTGAFITGHFNAFQKERIGWLNHNTSPSILAVTDPGQYAIEAYETPWGGGPKALRILKSTSGGSNTYIYAEERTQYGIDAALTPGILIHTGVDTDGSQIYEQDLQPSTTTTDFILSPGQSFTFSDAMPPVTLTALSADSTGALIAVTQPCVSSLGSSGQAFDAAGGPGSVSLNAPSDCAWTASSDSSWLTVNSGSVTGTGPSNVQFAVAPNAGASTLTGKLLIGGQTFTVTQAPCSYTVTPTSQSFDYTGGPGTVNITTASTCASTATTSTSWLTITGGASGTGSRAVSYSVASNSGSHAARSPSGTLTVAGQTVTITQEGLAALFTTPGPTNGATGVSQLPTFTWTNVGGNRYILQVGTTFGGTDLLDTGELSSSTTSFTLGTQLPASSLLYARVRTKWGFGGSATFTNSDITFTTVDRVSAVQLLGTQAPNPVPAGNSAQYGTSAATSLKVLFTGGGGTCTATLSATGLPTGATASFAPNSVTSSAVNQFTWLTINTSGSTPNGNYTVTLRAVENSGCGSATTTTTAPLAVTSALVLTSLSPAAATGTYGGTVGISATLTGNASPLSGKTVAFTLNGASIGSAVTNGSGVASLPGTSLSGISAGTYPTGVVATFAGDATNGASSANNSLTVNQKSVTPSVTATNKTYDRTTTAATTCALTGVIGADSVTCAGPATFASATVGAGKTVTATGLTLGGAQASNYTLSTTTATTTASIASATVTPSITAANKAYDRTTTATAPCTLSGVIAGDVVTCSGTATFADAAVGAGKTVTSSGLTLGGAQAGNYTLSTTTATATASITSATVTPSISAANKTYDRTTTATAPCTLSGVIAGDVVTCSGTATFADAAVGAGKTVTSSDLTLGGAQATYYTLSTTTATTTASITAATVTPSITAANKTYDRTTTATAPCTLSGVIAGDVVTCSGTTTFANAAVGAGKTVTASGLTLAGAQGSYYTLSTTTATTTASITSATVTPSISAANKTYDRTATATAPCTLSGVIAGDVVTCSGTTTFADAAVGAGKTVTSSGLTLGGAQAGNYTLSTTTASSTASITAATVTPSITAANKTYDRTTTATAPCTLSGVIAGDVVTCSGTTATFSSATVGTGKTVTASGITLAGAQAGNYSLASTSATTTANITAATVTASVTVANKAYDGTTAGSPTGCTLTGVLGADVVTCSSPTATFGSAAVGTGKTVIASGITLAGAKAPNYSLASTSATTTATITAVTLTPSVAVANKAYDGTTAATLTGCTLSGVLGTDAVGCTGTATFNSAAVGGIANTPSSTPTLIQHVSTASNNDATEPGNPFFMSLPNQTGAGNALILGMSYPFAAGLTPTVTDDKGNAWVAGVTTPSSPSNGQFVSRIFYALGVAAGTQKITVTFSAPVVSFQAVFSEFYNVATVAAADGSSGNAASTAPNVSAGSLTTASDGDLIYSYAFDAAPTSGITRLTAGSGFTLLSADTALGTVAEYAVQGSAGSVAPSVSVTGGTDRFNAVAIALKSQSAGTAPAPGIRIVHVYHVLYKRIGSVLQFPSTGNLLVVTTSFSPNQSTLNVSSSPANVWTKPVPVNAADVPQFLYAANASASPDLQITPTVTFPVTSIVMYDVAGAAISPYDSTAGVPSAFQSNTNNADLIGIPVITPSATNELIFGTMANGIGPTTGSIGPGFVLNTITYGGEIDRDSMDNADAYAHYYNPTTAPVSFSWKMHSSQLPETSLGVAIGFKSAPGGNFNNVTATGLTLTGAQAGNYTLSTTTATTTAAITTATVTPSITAASKTYDGTTTATAPCTLSGVIAGDVVTCSGIATFANAAVGAGKTVTASGLTLAGAQASYYTLSTTTATTTASIAAATLTPSITAANKTYDGTTTATAPCTLSGVIAGDVVTCIGTATFADAAVGAGKTVTASGLTLAGAQASYYALSTTTATATASITGATVTPSITATSKTYDGATTATAPCTLSGVVAGDVVTCSGIATFANAAVGAGKTVTASGLTLAGAQASYYTLSTTTATTTAAITAAPVTATFVVGNKRYDGSTNAVITSCTVSPLVGQEQVGCTGSAHFEDPDAGTNKTVILSGVSLTGPAAANYTLNDSTSETQPMISYNTTAGIDPATVTPTISAADKPYDRTPAATLTSCTLEGVVMGDMVGCTGTATFDTPAVGAGKTVTVADLTLTGEDAGNYTLSTTTATTTAAITAIALTPAITAASKPYDRTTSATLTGCTLTGVLGSDVVTCTGTATFDSALVGTGKTVTATGLTLSGAEAGNYTLSTTTATTTAGITAIALTPAIMAASRPYDGTTSATLTSCTLTGVLGSDVVTCAGTASFDSASVGTGKTVTATGLTLSGAAAANYTLATTTATTTAAITAIAVTPAITAASKSYDGTTTATLISCTLTGVLGTDTVTCTGTASFDSALVGAGKTVTAAGLTLSGAQAANYTLSTTTATTTAAITAIGLTPAIIAANKPYDSTTTATLTACALTGVNVTDVVTCTGTASFDSAAVGTGKTVTATGVTLTGAAAGNYTLSTTTATTTAAITAVTVTPTVMAADKSYDGTTIATLSGCSLSNVIGGDVVNCNASSAPRPDAPTLIQHVNTASNYDPLQLGNPYFISLPNAAGAGNALVIGVSYPFAPGRTLAITDDKSNVWMLGATTPNAPSNGQMVSSIYYALNVQAGTQKLTVTFNAPLYGFQAAVSEFFNVAIDGALDASSGNAASSAPNVTAGSLTTSHAGDLLYSYASDAHVTGTNTVLAAGAGFTLLSADVFLGNVAQYSIQAAPGPVNPSVAVSGSADPFNAVAIALRAATAGTAPGPGIRIVHVYHVFQRPGVPLQFPSTGNLLVVNTSFSPYQGNVEAVSSSPANSWTKPAPPEQMNVPQIWYAAGAHTSPDLSMAMTLASPLSLVMYDIAGAADSPYDATAGIPLVWRDNVDNSDLVDFPVITPSEPNELILAIQNNGLGPTTGMVGQGLVLDTITYGGEVDRDEMDNADGYAHYYSPGVSPVSFGWKMNSSQLPEFSEGIAVGFKGRATPVAAFDTASAGIGKTVTVSGLTLSGAAAGNYVLASTTATTTAAIAAVTVTPVVTVADKAYDGTTSATLATCTLSGVNGTDVVTCTGTASFDSAAVGTGKTVTATGLTLTGAAAGDYTLSTTTATTTAAITAVSVTPAITVASRPYDASTSATLATCTLSGLVGSDVVTCTGTASFDSAAVGTGKTVTASGLTLTGAAAGSYTLSATTATTTAAITAISLTPAITAASKPYDRTTSATLASCTLTGVLGSDVVTCTGTASFDSALVGTGKTVTATGLTLSGAEAGNYTLSTTTATTTAAITAIALTPAITAASRPYDRTTSATLTSCTLTGVLGSDAVTCTGTASFDSASVGTGKTVTATGLTLSGAAAANYTLATTTATTTAAITAIAVTPAITAASKSYDGTTTATITSCPLTGVLGSDVVICSGTAAFASAIVGTGKTVTATGLTLSGAQAGNYTLATTTATTTADITEIVLTPVITAASKPYDGATTATLTSCTLTGVLGSEAVTCTGTARFDSARVGTGRTVMSADLALIGAQAGNYTLATTTATTTAAITAISLTPAITAASKSYDGTATATLTSCTLTGAFSGDVVSCTGTATFDSAAVGAGKTVTAIDLTLTGAQAGNYTLASTTAATTAAIAPLSLPASITALNKAYDGTTTATLASCVLPAQIAVGTITVVWDANPNDQDVLGYRVQVGTSSGVYSETFDAGAVTSFVYPNALVGQAYFFAVTAYNAIGTSPYSEVSASAVPSGVLSGDAVTCTGTAVFDSAAIGTGKTVTASGLTLSGAQAGNYTLSTTTATTLGSITTATVTATVTVANKLYDGSTAAAIASCTLSGVIGTDQVTCTATASFLDPAAGTDKTVHVSGVSLVGSAAANYTLVDATSETQPLISFDTTADIDPAIVTAVVSAANKPYDGATAATLTSCTLNGVVSEDQVTCSGTATFDTASVGAAKAVTVTNVTLTGAAAGDYTLGTTTATTTAAISAVSLTPAIAVASKPYDASTTATLTGCTLTGVIGTDVVTCTGAASFDSAAIGTGKTVTANGLTLTGAAAGNYTLSNTTATTTAAITAVSVTPAITVASRPYDATTSATLTTCTLSGLAGADVVSCTGTVSFDSAAVGTGKTVTATGLTLTGAAAGNYTLASTTASTTAAISARSVTPHVTVADKRYDGTTTATITGCTLSGLITGETASCTGTAVFSSAAAGTGKLVTATQLTLSGAAATNYALTTTTATTTATIIANRAPVIANPGPQSGYQGIGVTLTLTGTDQDGDSLTWSAQALPPGVGLSSSGVLSGTPTAMGTFLVTVSATDGWDPTPMSFTWTMASPIPVAASPLSPSGSIATTTPALSWPAVPLVEYYLLWIEDSGVDSPLQLWYTPSQANCATGTCTVPSPRALKAGLVTYKVLTWNHFGYGPWSPTISVVVDLADAAVPTPTTSGPSGAIATRTPTYSWSVVSNATWYQLSVTDVLGAVREFWYTPAQACTSSCAATPSSAVATGLAHWRVRAWRASGAGAWSASVSFDAANTLPGKVTLRAPTGSVATSTPVFTWDAISTASYYLLHVTDRDNVITERWYRPGDVGCALGVGVCTATPGIVLKAGAATWAILTWNGSGYGPWSNTGDILIEVPDPSAPAPATVSPTGTIGSTTVPYRWTAVLGALNYRLSIGNNGGQPTYVWFSPAAAGCGAGGECSVIPAIALANGTAQWQVQAWTNIGYGAWSSIVTVGVTIAAPPAPVLISPGGTLANGTPLFRWNASDNTVLYWVRAFDPSGQRVDRWLSPSQVGCPTGGVCTLNAGVTLAHGAGTWQVIAWNFTGYSPWSSTVTFTVP